MARTENAVCGGYVLHNGMLRANEQRSTGVGVWPRFPFKFYIILGGSSIFSFVIPGKRKVSIYILLDIQIIYRYCENSSLWGGSTACIDIYGQFDCLGGNRHPRLSVYFRLPRHHLHVLGVFGILPPHFHPMSHEYFLQCRRFWAFFLHLAILSPRAVLRWPAAGKCIE